MVRRIRIAVGRHDRLTLAGLAAGVVPLAALVHLLAEFAATGAGSGDAFAGRHLYLLPLALGGLVACAAALGFGQGRHELVRRAAATRAAMRRAGALGSIRDLFIANLAFFALTQAVEGVPIAAGSVAVGLAVAAVGSLLAALAVFALGRTFHVAVALALVSRRRARGCDLPVVRRDVRATRSAARAFTLCLPNRPPPVLLSI